MTARIAGLTVLLVLAPTIAAYAQVTPEQQSAIRANCRGDFTSKCAGVTPGGKEALTCLQTNVATLSAGCKTAVTATLPKPAPAPAAAAPAAAPTAAPATAAKRETTTTPAPAAPVTAGPAAPKPPQAPKSAAAAKPAAPKPAATAPAPVPASAAKTASAPPTAAPPPAAPATHMPKAPIAESAIMLRACRFDLMRHCANVELGDGRKLACLASHESSLTFRCRTALKVSTPLR